MRFDVQTQINNGDPCPKSEDRAWDYEDKVFPTLTECINFLISTSPDGFSIRDNGEEIACNMKTHCS